MIPLELTLKNFLSYQEATLDFRGLHTACICGANGAGKSSLLEAITWVIWGESRAAVDEDVIHAGCDYARVDFQFICHQEVYRIIRSRHRSRHSHLEFQVESAGQFRSLTAKGIRATQEKIIASLKLDYHTFINSAYLRQGRADEFMLRRPTERKKILADLLKLDQYQQLADQAKDLSKQYQGQAKQIELSLTPIKDKLAQKKTIQEQQKELAQEIQTIQLNQEQERLKLQQLQGEEHQRQTWLEQLNWQQQQDQNLIKDEERFTKEKNEINQQITRLISIIEQENQIREGYQNLLKLQKEEKTLSTQFKLYQEQQQKQQFLRQKLVQKNNEIQLQIRQVKTQLETLENQEQELQYTLNKADEIQAALQQLAGHRQRLHELDKLQHQVSPLQQRRYSLQIEIDQIKANFKAQLDQLYLNEQDCLKQLDKIPEMRKAALEIDTKIQELENKQVYQKRVEEKGQEKKEFQERLKENQRISQEKIEELQQKLQQLEVPHATCPLCEQGLDETHRNHVITKTQLQQQEIKEKIWMLQEQMSVGEKELKILREEYSQLKKELAAYPSLQQQFGQLEAQLETIGEVNTKLKHIKNQIHKSEQALTQKTYAVELQTELNTLNQKLQQLNYDEQTHALVRGEVERCRKAEIKQAKLEEANRRQSVILQQKPQLVQKIANLNQQIEQLNQDSELKQELDQLEQSLKKLGYDNGVHQQLLESLRQSQSWQLRLQELEQAKQKYPQLQNRLQIVETRLKEQQTEKENIKQQLNNLSAKVESIVNQQAEIATLEKKIQNQRQKLDELLAQRGRLEQSIAQLDNLKQQYFDNQKQLKEIQKKYRVYQELAKAFGKNGIQALMIENILPQLEAETNHILARLTGNQLHIQFVTQRAGRGGSSRKSTKIIDTLDILIADAKGTRSYETYSGGEAFRINFSIRLALAKLLAQRAGTSLQMLIVDEGFGTQDTQGCERLIAAINAIASDFSCILTVTHMPQFKEAFQYRIEVYKNAQGSQLNLVS